MAHIKIQQKKLLRAEVTKTIMQYLMGLNEKNKLKVEQRVKNSSKKIVDDYYKALEKQHKKIKNKMNNKEKISEVLAVAEPLEFIEQANAKAS